MILNCCHKLLQVAATQRYGLETKYMLNILKNEENFSMNACSYRILKLSSYIKEWNRHIPGYLWGIIVHTHSTLRMLRFCKRLPKDCFISEIQWLCEVISRGVELMQISSCMISILFKFSNKTVESKGYKLYHHKSLTWNVRKGKLTWMLFSNNLSLIRLFVFFWHSVECSYPHVS